ncbi:hypothetical protein BH11MYX1_BH11MYX1_32550 [soil metagenome]
MLAERWFGLGSIVLALTAAGFALRPAHHHRHHRGPRAVSPLELAPSRCSGTATITPPPPMAVRDDGYAAVMRATDVDRCLTTSARVDMILYIARDGHLKGASHRPEHETEESRCIEKALTGAQFPAGNGVSTTLRYSFTK